MNLLGSVGQLYTFILLVLLFLGFGLAAWKLINFLVERVKAKRGSQQIIALKNTGKERGGFLMGTNGWLKLAVFSLVGMVVSVLILGFVSTNNSQNAYPHQQYPVANGNANMMGYTNISTPMGNMNGNMQMSSMTMNGQSNYNMIQQMNQMQMMLNQMQQQIMMMNGMSGGASMQGSAGMSGMPSSGSMQGGSMSGGSSMQGGMGMGMGGGMMGGMM